MRKDPKSLSLPGEEPVDPSLLDDLENLKKGGRKKLEDRAPVRLKVILRNGNSSQLAGLEVQGITGNISGGGCLAIFPVPIGVGDVYRLEFEKGSLDIPLVFSRCLRCRLIHESAFEAGFTFFSPVQIGNSREVKSSSNDLLR
jgi:hypothetical protein